MHTRITIEVNGRVHEVENHTLTVSKLRELAGHHEGAVYRLEGEHRRHLPDHETLHVHNREQFVVEHGHHEKHHHPIPIEVDGKRFEAPNAEMTGATIKALAHKPQANRLYRVEKRDDHPFHCEIGDSEIVHLHPAECFVTQPPVGKAS